MYINLRILRLSECKVQIFKHNYAGILVDRDQKAVYTMSNPIQFSHPSGFGGATSLAARITKLGSKQTYYTFRILVSRDRLEDAYRAYAYFRWLDDQLDCQGGTRAEKLALVNHQRELLTACYSKQPQAATCPEEQMLLDLFESDCEETSGLQFYLRNMMGVMAFDVERRGRLINQEELTEYSRLLATAVTELLFYFIDQDDSSPRNEDRYQAVRGAHIVHMLRDMLDDIDLGYINLPVEILESHQVSASHFDNPAFREWVFGRVKLAHQCFAAGRKYFARVKSLRCRLAAYAYLARFEWMLMIIERNKYRLRRSYPERKSLRAGGWMAWHILMSIFNISGRKDVTSPLPLAD
jgi:phytoene/squalene synthetase